MIILEKSFYRRNVQTVARELLGKKLVRVLDGTRISGIISETEAYDGEKDLACHASCGITQRNQVMYGKAGCAYIYFTYGMHWMLNFVAGEDGYPAAVLIRSILPIEGLDIIRKNRSPITEMHWTDGPAKLTKALSITGNLNGVTLSSQENGLWVENGPPLPDKDIKQTARIGIKNTPEPWRSKPWRFVFQN